MAVKCKSSVFVAACSGLALLAPGAPAHAQHCSAKSPAHTLALVELYTSEGCDSCPPADKWLGSLATSREPESVVPLALHVDYWDYIGWKDPFAKPQFVARQREIAAATGKSFVYTPQVVFNGRDYRGWSGRAFVDDIAKTNAEPARANIELSMSIQPDGRIEARAVAKVPYTRYRADAVLQVAVYQNGLSTAVAAGENRGRTLHHNFVARAWAGPSIIDPAGNAELAISARIPAATSKNAGVAAFIQNRRNGSVLQAFSLPLCAT